jgi:hypothetical protein
MFISRRFCAQAGLLVLLPVLFIACDEPPLDNLATARRSITHARTAGAPKYDSTRFEQARSLFEQGELELARQRGRLAPLRDYSRSDSLLRRAALLADSSQITARRVRDELRLEAQQTDKALHRQLAAWRAALDDSMRLFAAEKHWRKADLALDLASRLVQQQQFEAAMDAFLDVGTALDRLGETVESYTSDGDQKISIWNTWVRETVDHSRRNKTTALVVVKHTHRLYVVTRGRVTTSFACDLGYNAAHQKLFAGDGATPEGKYRITAVRPIGSKYYKALNLDYPSARDRQRFAENQARGVISPDVGIGALIEIHGDGSRGSDWTDGCVALSNKDMDSLIKLVKVGTPVTIVRRAENFP